MVEYIVIKLRTINDGVNILTENSSSIKQIAYDVYGSRLAILNRYIETDVHFTQRIRIKRIQILNDPRIQFCIGSIVSVDDKPSCVTYLQSLNSLIVIEGDTYNLPSPPQALVDAYNSIYSSEGTFPYNNTTITREQCSQADYDATASWLESLNGN